MKFNQDIELNIKKIAKNIDVYDLLDKLDIDYSKGKEYKGHNGINLMIPCPFHHDNSPSFGIIKETLISNCFVCGGFNLVSFTIKVKREVHGEQFSYTDCIKFLRELAGEIEVVYEFDELERKLKQLENPKETKVNKKKKVEKEPLPEGLVSAINHRYLIDKRGFTNKTINKFKLQYCKYGKYNHRIIAPIIEDNKYRGFLARDVLPFLTGKNYSNRKRVLHSFGMDEDFLFNHDRVMGRDSVFVNEGLFDTVKMTQLKIPAVALMGSDLKDKQFDLLIKFKRIILCLDNDETGFDKTFKIGDTIDSYVDVRVAIYDEDDPGDLESREQIRKVVSFDEWKSKHSWKILLDKLKTEGGV